MKRKYVVIPTIILLIIGAHIATNWSTSGIVSNREFIFNPENRYGQAALAFKAVVEEINGDTITIKPNEIWKGDEKQIPVRLALEHGEFCHVRPEINSVYVFFLHSYTLTSNAINTCDFDMELVGSAEYRAYFLSKYPSRKINEK